MSSYINNIVDIKFSKCDEKLIRETSHLGLNFSYYIRCFSLIIIKTTLFFCYQIEPLYTREYYDINIYIYITYHFK